MYSTKLVNSRIVANNAYITVGDPYEDPTRNPFRNTATKKGEKSPSPFQVIHNPKNAENGCFTKVEYKGGDVQDVIHYIASQPLDQRKKGFGSKDAKRRDEFANAMRTEQFRATILREQALLKKQKRIGDAKNGPEIEITTEDGNFEDIRVEPELFLYDIGRSRVTEFDPKLRRDKYFSGTNHSQHRRLPVGGTLPASTVWGSGLSLSCYECKPPQFGVHAATQHFQDKSHLH